VPDATAYPNWSLDGNNLSITAGQHTIPLLPKEFNLLAFLLQNPGRVFARDQLLDAVWADEAPVDRTVDDHVYRLRKKLRSLQATGESTIAIETVRSKGYRLVIGGESRNVGVVSNPMLQSPEYKEQIRNMFDQYVLYGHGSALRTLANQPEVFGVDADLELYLRAQFQTGNFRAVVESRYPFTMKLFWLLSLYRSIHANHSQALKYLDAAVSAYLLPTERHLEIQCFHIPGLHLQIGNLDRAKEMIADAIMTTETMDLEGYQPAIRMLEVMCALYQGRLADVRSGLDRVQELLVKYPWQPEAAHHQIVEGLYELITGNPATGRRLVLTGIDRLEQIGIPGHLIIRVQEQLHFVTHVAQDAPLQQELQVRWKALAQQYEFDSLERTIERELRAHAL